MFTARLFVHLVWPSFRQLPDKPSNGELKDGTTRHHQDPRSLTIVTMSLSFYINDKRSIAVKQPHHQTKKELNISYGLACSSSGRGQPKPHSLHSNTPPVIIARSLYLPPVRGGPRRSGSQVIDQPRLSSASAVPIHLYLGVDGSSLPFAASKSSARCFVLYSIYQRRLDSYCLPRLHNKLPFAFTTWPPCTMQVSLAHNQ